MAPPGLAAALRAADRRAGELVSQRRLAEAVTLNERMLAVAPDQLSLLVQKGTRIITALAVACKRKFLGGFFGG